MIMVKVKVKVKVMVMVNEMSPLMFLPYQSSVSDQILNNC